LDAKEGLTGWTFGSVAFWGETGVMGTWTLQIFNSATSDQEARSGQFVSWRLTVWGESEQAKGDFDADAYATAFVNNYFPPSVDYFSDVDGVFRGQLTAAVSLDQRSFQDPKKVQTGWFFVFGLGLIIITFCLFYMTK
jgi:hypothetical protein